MKPDWIETDQQGWSEVDAALRSLELVEPPPGLVAGALVRIRRLPERPAVPEPGPTVRIPSGPGDLFRPRFQLEWLDIALCIWLPGIVALMLLALNSLPLPVWQFLGLKGLYWLARLQLEPSWLVAPVAAFLIMLGSGCVFWWALERPARIQV